MFRAESRRVLGGSLPDSGVQDEVLRTHGTLDSEEWETWMLRATGATCSGLGHQGSHRAFCRCQ